MRQLILGTAGHIDHGKTSLIRALTGVDTDRLQEEKERGITIDLGFAELTAGNLRFGIVDVPGHEAFVKNMLAGATGVDVVLVVVAADEGVMPQTTEHLAIVELLGVSRVVVALTKSDLVDPEWLELAEDDVRDTLATSPWPDAPVLPVSSVTREGLDALVRALEAAGSEALSDPARGERSRDLLQLPVDRAFTVRGTGTVVTGTLRSGRMIQGDRVRLLPAGLEARVRGLQVHGAEVEAAEAGARTAVALTGDGVTVEAAGRGQVLVTVPAWEASSMLTARVRVLPESSWELAQGQRVRLHLGTAEVMARCVLLGAEGGASVPPGGEGWIQLRLERPVAARVGQRFVLRSYSPVVTFAGGTIAEYQPPKRRSAGSSPLAVLAAVLDGDPAHALEAALQLAGPAGIAEELLPVASGLPPATVERLLQGGAGDGAGVPLRAGNARVSLEITHALAGRIARAVDTVHESEPFRPGPTLEEVRALAPHGSARGLADAVVASLEDAGELTVSGSVVHRPGHTPVFTPDQEAVRTQLLHIYRDGGLQPPATAELPESLTSNPAFPWILRELEATGVLVSLEAEYLALSEVLEATAREVVSRLGGMEGLGPADFKEVIPVTRRYLLPVLRYLDGRGITRNEGNARSVSAVFS